MFHITFHILNPFPDLLIYSLWAPVILRFVVGYFLLSLGGTKFRAKAAEGEAATPAWWKICGIIEFILGITFMLGFGVQVDAVLAIILFAGIIIFYQKINFPKKLSPEVYWLLLLISISLLLSGAGLPAIDLPL